MKYAIDLFNHHYLPSTAKFRHFDGLWDDFIHSSHGKDTPVSSLARVSEMSESESHYFLSLDVPGVAREDLNIEFKDNVLSVSGERRQEKTDAKPTGWSEVSFGKFRREFELPQGIEADKIEADYTAGVLSIQIAKSEAKKAKLISISDGKKESVLSRLKPK